MVKRRRAKVLAAAMLATACGGVALTGSAGAESEPPPSTFPARPLAVTISAPVGQLSPSHDLAGLFGMRIEPGPQALELRAATQVALEPLPGPFPPVLPPAEPEPFGHSDGEATQPEPRAEAPAPREPSAGHPPSEAEAEEPAQAESEQPATAPPGAVDDGTDPGTSAHEDPGPSDAALARLRACESGGDYTIVSSGGWYRGAYQFDQETWDSVASRWQPALVGIDPAQASPTDQDAMARALYAERGWAPWPVCGLGL